MELTKESMEKLRDRFRQMTPSDLNYDHMEVSAISLICIECADLYWQSKPMLHVSCYAKLDGLLGLGIIVSKKK